MNEYCQHYKREWAEAGIAIGVCFIGVALDMRFTQWMVKTSEPVPFWICLVVGVFLSTFSLKNFFRPPLILHADQDGLRIGSLSGRKRVSRVSWNEVESIGVTQINVRRDSRQQKQAETALRIECIDSVELSGGEDRVHLSEPCPAYVAVIGQYYFDKDVLQVQSWLQEIAAANGKTL